MDSLRSWLDAKEVRRLAEGLMEPPPEVDESAADAGYGDAFEGFAGSVPSDRAKSDQPVLNVPPNDPGHQQQHFFRRTAVQSEGQESAIKSCDDDGHLKSVAGDEDESQQVAAESSLANAKRVAVSSGMLGHVQYSKQNAASEFEAGPHQPEGSDNSGPPDESPVAKVTSPVAQDQVGMRGPFLSRLQEFSDVIRRDLGAQAMFLTDNEGGVILDEIKNAKLVRVAQTLANASFRASQQTVGAPVVGNLHVKISASAILEVIPVETSYGLLILGVVFSAPIGSVSVMQVAKELYRIVEPHH